MSSPRWLPSLLGSLALAATTLLRAADLPRATPEAQGISSAALQALVDEADARRLGLHGLVIVRHGHVVADGWWAPYAATEPHLLFSLSKSFTSAAIGLLQAEGKLDIHDPLLRYFPADAPAAPSANLQAMRLRDLLMMSTGQEKADVDRINVMAADGSGTRQFLAAPVRQKPGTLFSYNSPATFMLSAVVQRITGETLRAYLGPRLFAPLGIATPEWDQTPQGITFGASGLRLRTSDLAKFGQLLLQRGEWEGRRLLPAAWIDLATSRQTANGSNPDSDWEQGYGFQFWRCLPGFYRGDGAFGQFCIVMPQHDTVVAINSGAGDMGAIMKLLWRRLLPELRAAPLPDDPAAHARLTTRLAELTLPPTAGAATSPLAASFAGRRYLFAPGDANPDGFESLQLALGPTQQLIITLVRRGQTLRAPAGHGTWSKGEWAAGPGTAEPAAFSGAWTADDAYTLQICRTGTPFIHTLHLRFQGREVAAEFTQNVGFAAGAAPALVGVAE